MTKEEACDRFVEAVQALTESGAIKWRSDCDDQRADLTLVMLENEDCTHNLRAWNTIEENEKDEVSCFDTTGENIERLVKSIENRAPQGGMYGRSIAEDAGR